MRACLGVTALGGYVPELANDDEPDPTPPAPAPAMIPPAPSSELRVNSRRLNFTLNGDRGLTTSWKERAKANVDAIVLADKIEKADRPATQQEQEQLNRFTGFGTGELANSMFRRPGAVDFRNGWNELGGSLEGAVSESEYALLARCMQYAHFILEFVVQAIWSALQRLGWRGGRVLEPGIGTGLFPALIPETLRDASHFTGIELDPVTARKGQSRFALLH